MTPEEKSLLERTYQLAQENNQILVGLRRSNRLSTAMRVAYWAIIILLSFGAYYLIQPYVTMLLNVSGQGSGIEGIGNSLNNAQGAANSLQDLFK